MSVLLLTVALGARVIDANSLAGSRAADKAPPAARKSAAKAAINGLLMHLR